MRPYFVSLAVAVTALALSGCSGEVDIEPGIDTTAMVDSAAPVTETVVDTTGAVDTTTITTTTTTQVTTDPAAPAASTPATTGATTTTKPATSGSTTTTTTPPPATPPPATPPPSKPVVTTPPPATPPPTPTAPTGGGDGKAAFLSQKCNTCHGIAAQGISKTMASSKAPDLGGADMSLSASTIEKYLMKTEKVNGKDHVKKWGGSQADLSAVSSWLAGLK